MSTNANFYFEDMHSTNVVFMHWDGYPKGAADVLKNTLESGLALPLHWFEADEFAAAFIAANKREPGGFRVKNPGDIWEVDYTYIVWKVNDELMINVVRKTESIFNGTMTEFFDRVQKDTDFAWDT